MAGDALKSTIKVDGAEVTVRTGELQTCLNCDRPKIVGGIVSILHGWILKSRGSTKDDRADGYDAGLRAFAWWKDGVQYVGTSGTTLTEAIKKGERDA